MNPKGMYPILMASLTLGLFACNQPGSPGPTIKLIPVIWGDVQTSKSIGMAKEITFLSAGDCNTPAYWASFLPVVTGFQSTPSGIGVGSSFQSSTMIGTTPVSMTTTITMSGQDTVFTGTYSDDIGIGNGTYVLTLHNDDTFTYSQTVIYDWTYTGNQNYMLTVSTATGSVAANGSYTADQCDGYCYYYYPNPPDATQPTWAAFIAKLLYDNDTGFYGANVIAATSNPGGSNPTCLPADTTAVPTYNNSTLINSLVSLTLTSSVPPGGSATPVAFSQPSGAELLYMSPSSGGWQLLTGAPAASLWTSNGGQ